MARTKCTKCNVVFSRMEGWDQHWDSNGIFNCNIENCTFGSCTLGDLETHVRNSHPNAHSQWEWSNPILVRPVANTSNAASTNQVQTR